MRRQKNVKKTVPVLITWDIDPCPEANLEDKRSALAATLEMLEKLQIKSSFFFVALLAKHFSKEISAIIDSGHNIGCHGLTHGDEEEYNRMPKDLQRNYIYRATNMLHNITNRPVVIFRGPRVKTSHVAHDVLEEAGYIADCSVCSQRIDFVSSNFINTSWIFAPRLPYHPRKSNAFRKGNRKIWVISNSAIILPFISSCLYVLGLNFMKA